ncbi:hypothetical protein AGMMS49573_02690 [Endomicrobiia bacterium]|nr:hypothetical protein AGMMS49573_02690 [Endomicrobiia bacterium]
MTHINLFDKEMQKFFKGAARTSWFQGHSRLLRQYIQRKALKAIDTYVNKCDLRRLDINIMKDFDATTIHIVQAIWESRASRTAKKDRD